MGERKREIEIWREFAGEIHRKYTKQIIFPNKKIFHSKKLLLSLTNFCSIEI